MESSEIGKFKGLETFLTQMKELGFETVLGGETIYGLLLDLPLYFDENIIILAFEDFAELDNTKKGIRGVRIFLVYNTELKVKDSLFRIVINKLKKYAAEPFRLNSLQSIENLYGFSQNENTSFENFAHLFFDSNMNRKTLVEAYAKFQYNYEGCISLECNC